MGQYEKIRQAWIYNFKRANWNLIKEDLLEVDWEHILSKRTIETSWNKFLLYE